MSLEYLSGIGRNKSPKAQARQANRAAPPKPAAQKKAERVQKTLKREEKIKKLIVNTPQARILKAVAKQSPIAAQKIQKAAVQAQQKRAFKKANQAAVIKQKELEAAARAEEAYNIPIEVEEEQGIEEVDEPEFNDFETGGENDEIGIIYPDVINGKAERKAKKATKQAFKTGKKGAKVANKRGKAQVKTARATNIKSGNRGAGLKSALTKGGELLQQYLNKGSGGGDSVAPPPPPPAETTNNKMLLYGGLGLAAVVAVMALKK
jgi:hypothetical protein